MNQGKAYIFCTALNGVFKQAWSEVVHVNGEIFARTEKVPSQDYAKLATYSYVNYITVWREDIMLK